MIRPVSASIVALLLATLLTKAQDTPADVLADPALDLNRPADRAKAVAKIKAIEDARAAKTRAKAKALGLQIKTGKPDGGLVEIVDFEGDRPVYIETKNLNAAISTGANLVQASPYGLDGTGIIAGVWDGGSVRSTHQEFANGSRVTIMDGAAEHDHATHVGGTIGAQGTNASAKGMATNVSIDSYDWTSDTSEMTGRAATGPNQFDTKIYLSNHSYGGVNGWNGIQWVGNGTDQNAADYGFGQYDSQSRTLDLLLYGAPYYTAFWAAGNDGSDNPSTGSTVLIGSTFVAYDPAIHPPGDGVYRNGFETIASYGIAKNLITIGAANDAVTSGSRDPSKSTLTSFSSTGPTDDGRIKPDLVANGATLTSTVIGSDTSYGPKSGTSMATPNTTGSAVLVVDQYKRLFNSAMRASTFKALLIHTATDIGNPGPDYKYGWGLLDTKKAVDLIRDHHANPVKTRIIEDQVTTSSTTGTYSFHWDGESPLRATVCWADPAAASTTSHDSRTSRLVNNLNLKLIAPDGIVYSPYVMPFVGTWTTASMSQNATTGINNTDNTETVYIQSPVLNGTWQAVVSYTGVLTNNTQAYGLILSGTSNTPNLVDITEVDGTNVVEGGATDTYTLSLTTAPTANVTVSISPNAQVATSTSNVTFTTANWNTPQTVTVTAANDAAIEGNHTGLITHAATSSDPTFNGVSIASVIVNITDNDDIVLTAPNGGESWMAGSTQNITWTSLMGGNVKLELLRNGFLDSVIIASTPNDGAYSWTIPSGQLPTTEYRVRISSVETSASLDTSLANFTVSAIPSTLVSQNFDAASTFPADWSNTTASGTVAWTISTTKSHTPTRSAFIVAPPSIASAYLTSAAMAIPAGMTGIQFSFYHDYVFENGWDGGLLEFSIDGGPWFDVTSSGSGASFGQNGYTLASVPTNYSNPIGGRSAWSGNSGGFIQTIVNLTDTAKYAGKFLRARWLMGSDSSTGTAGWYVDTVALKGIAAGPTVGVVIAQSGGSTNVTEGGATDTYTLNLISQPTANVTVTVTPNSQVSVSPTSLTFTTSNWAAAQTVTVTAVNDTLNEFAHTGSISHTSTSADAYYNNLALTGVTVNITDNDNAAPVVNAGPDQSVVLSGTVWSPANAGPLAWYDANDAATITQVGGAVSQWADKAGTSHMVQATGTKQPVSGTTQINGLNSIAFDGVDDTLKTATNPFGASISNAMLIGVFNIGTISNSTLFSLSGAITNRWQSHSPYGNGTLYFDCGGSGAPNRISGASGFAANQNRLLGFYCSTTDNVQQVWVDGTNTLSDASGHTVNTSSGMAFGHDGSSTTDFDNCRMGEVVVINGTVSADNRQKLEGYLAHKWGLAGSLPAAHPYKSTSPNSLQAVATLDGTASDANSDPLTYAWTVVSGPGAVAFGNAAAIDTTATFTVDGTYTLRLTANDSGAQTADTVVITVGPYIPNYTVTYNGNGNTGGTAPTDASSPYASGSTVSVLGAGTLTRTGHTFAGWNTQANGTGTAYAASATFTITANTTLYAQWTPDTYIVSYNGNGSTGGNVPANQNKLHDINLTLATNSGGLVKAGFSFIGWNTKADGTGIDYPAASTYSANSSITLYAKWTSENDGTWLPTAAGPFNWSDTANWSGGIFASGSNRNALFTPNITAAQTVNLDATITIGNITFTDSTTSSHDLTISGANFLTLARSPNAPVIDVTQSGRTLTISSNITGTNGLQKDGVGKLTLSGTDNYTGTTTISAGTLQVGSAGTSGSLTGTSGITNNANLTINRTNAFAQSTDLNGSVISGTGSFTQAGSGTTTLSAANSYTGQTSITAGTLSINKITNYGVDSSIGKGTAGTGISFTGGTLNYTGTGDSTNRLIQVSAGNGSILNNGSGALNFTATGNFSVQGSTTTARTLSLGGTNGGTITGAIQNNNTGAIALTKTDAGTWTLNGDNTYTGSTTVSGGTLKIAGGGSFYGNAYNATAVVTVQGGGVLELDTWSYGASESLGQLQGDSAARIVINNGTIRMNGNTAYGRGVTVQSGGATFEAASGANWTHGGADLTANVYTGNPSLTFTGAGTGTFVKVFSGSGSLTKSGAGTWTLTAANTYSGLTTVNSGTLAVTGTGKLYTSLNANLANAVTVNSGCTLEFDNWSWGGSFGQLWYDKANMVINGGTLRYVGTTANGSADRSFTIGASGATLESAASGQKWVVVSSTGYPTLSRSGGTLTLTGAGDGQIDQIIPGSGGLTKSGNGTWTFAGANTYTGTTTVSAGKLFINGNQPLATGNVSVAANATLGGTGIIGGNTTIAASGRLEFDLSTNAASHNKLELAAGKTLTFSGASTLTITSSGGAAVGSYVLLSAPGGLTVATLPTLILPNYWTATVSKVGNDLVLNVTAVSPFGQWAVTNGLSGGNAASGADPDGDGLTNLQEFAFGTLPNSAVCGPLEFVPGGEVTKPGSPVLRGYTPSQGEPPFQAVFGRRKNHVAAGLTYTAEFSANLTYWTPSNSGSSVLTGAGSHEIEVVAIPFPATVPLSLGGTDTPPKFFRVVISQN